MSIRHPRVQHKDSGASLLLAIGSVLMIGAISAGLAAAATSSLQNRTTLELVRDREYAADGAIEQAIAQVRQPAYTCATMPSSHLDAAPMNGIEIRVDWFNDCSQVTGSDGAPYDQRNVVFVASCLNPTDSTCNFSDVIIRAEVNFQTEPPKTYVQSWSVNR